MKTLRKYMKKNQICNIFSINFFIMIVLSPIYVVDYQFNESYYNNLKVEENEPH